MKYLLYLLAIVILGSCTSQPDYNGFYVTKGYFESDQYMTLNIFDTIIYLNQNNISPEQIDTFIMDRKTFSITNSFPIVALKPYKDSVALVDESHAWQIETIFYKSPAKQSPKDWFCKSRLDIDLKEYNSETDTLTTLNDKKIHNLNIGYVKSNLWSYYKKDSVIIEDYDFEIFVNKSDYNELFDYLNEFKKDGLICLNSDKLIPDSINKQVRNDLSKYCDKSRIIESRIKNDKIVYIK